MNMNRMNTAERWAYVCLNWDKNRTKQRTTERIRSEESAAWQSIARERRARCVLCTVLLFHNTSWWVPQRVRQAGERIQANWKGKCMAKLRKRTRCRIGLNVTVVVCGTHRVGHEWRQNTNAIEWERIQHTSVADYDTRTRAHTVAVVVFCAVNASM